MDWQDINDPTDEFDFHTEWTLVSSQYTADEIQAMINDIGVQSMVHAVNEHFKLITGHTVLVLSWVGGRKAVVQA